MDPKDRVFHVISNTHWDREWRFPFQRNRQMLVEMMDRLLSILDREPEYRAFHLDSQSVVVEDYLEIRPHRREEIRKWVEQKRLFIGPWYILPDEFLVGGENLVRNLLLGHKICAPLGGASKVGYSPFSWGQISQLPQLYKEFGIDVILFYRGINSLESPKAEFIWEGADGTLALSSRFSTMPRYNFYFYVYRPVVHNEGFQDIECPWNEGGTAFHFADDLCHEDYAIACPSDGYYPERIKSQVEAIVRDQADDFTTPHVIWMEGHDSSGPNEKTVRILRDIRKEMPELTVLHGTLEEYAHSLKQAAIPSRLPLVKGERRSAQYDRRSGNLYGYTTSARMYIKQKNFEAEKWLTSYAEPFTCIAGLLGLDIHDLYLETAWRMLIQNSAHDSIGGCSLDEVHEDMMNRYKQSLEISKGIFGRACRWLAPLIHTRALKRGKEDEAGPGLFLVALNPTNYRRGEVLRASIDIPQSHDLGEFDVLDEEGISVSKQIMGAQDVEPVLERMTDRPMYFKMRRYDVYLDLQGIVPMGYKTFSIRPTEKKKKVGGKIGKIGKKGPVLENEFLRIQVHRNGALSILNKKSGHAYERVAYFDDEGEAGHAWVHKPCPPHVDTTRSRPFIVLLENGSLSATVLVEHTMRVPADPKGEAGGNIRVRMKAGLKKGAKIVELEVEVENAMQNHRLRAMFPTRLKKATHHWGEGQFDVVKRDIRRPDTRNWLEQPMYDFPMHHFMDISDGENGLSIFAQGLKEYEVMDDEQITVAVTLLRAFSYTIQPSSRQDYSYQQGSQCLGRQVYKMALYPHEGDWVVGNVYEEALKFDLEPRLFEIGPASGTLPPTLSFLEIVPSSLVFSALKLPETPSKNEFVLRIYNPTDRDIPGRIRSFFRLEKVQACTLEEKALSILPVQSQNEVEVNVPKKKICTLRMTFFEERTI